MNKLLFGILLVSSISHADEATCRAVLHDCDIAVQALQKENALQKQIIADEDTRFATEQKELSTEQLWRPLAIGGVVVIGVETLIILFKH